MEMFVCQWCQNRNHLPRDEADLFYVKEDVPLVYSYIFMTYHLKGSKLLNRTFYPKNVNPTTTTTTTTTYRRWPKHKVYSLSPDPFKPHDCIVYILCVIY